MAEGTWVPAAVADRLAGCTGARGLFERARDAALDAERVRRRLKDMESREGLRGVRYDRPLVMAGRSAGMPATEARVGFEEAKRRQVEADEALCDLAFHVLYGDGLDAGAAALTSEAHAQVVERHWLQLMTWAETAERVGYSERHCRRMSDELFDACDAHGLVATIAGRGFAEG